MPRVTGVGGVFLRSPDPERLARWYAEHLGVPLNDWGGSTFPGATTTAWSVVDLAAGQPVVTYTVDDLGGLLDALAAGGARVDAERQVTGFGSFGWVYDCDDNRIELWQPAA